MQEIYYTEKFTAERMGNEFLVFSQNPLHLILAGKVLWLEHLSAFFYNHLIDF